MFQTPCSFSLKMNVNAPRGLSVPSQQKRALRQSMQGPKRSPAPSRTALFNPSLATTRSADCSSVARSTSTS